MEDEELDDKPLDGGVRRLTTPVHQNSETPCDRLWFKLFLFIMMDPVVNNSILRLFRALWARHCWYLKCFFEPPGKKVGAATLTF